MLLKEKTALQGNNFSIFLNYLVSLE